jgi:hypothetical protein
VVRELLLNKGWRRHSLLSIRHDSLNHVFPHLPEKIQSIASIKGAILIIATYDCAVVNSCFDTEPWVQLLAAFPVEFEKQFAQGRDPRKIHFTINHFGQKETFETNAASIVQIERKLLCNILPDDEYELVENSKYDLKNWLAERFKQDTWPDAFNKAVKPIEKRLKRLWKRYNEHISSLYLKLNTYDELDHDKYSVAIIVAIEVGKQRALVKLIRSNNKQLIDKPIDDVMKDLSNEVINIFGDTVIIEDDPTTSIGKAIEVIGEDGITIHHLRSFHRFSPYTLSEFEKDTPLPIDMVAGKSN